MFKTHRKRPLLSLIVLLALVCTLLTVPTFAASGDVRIEMTIGETDYTLNGTAKTVDSAPYINADGYTMVPIRFLGEAIGANVEWSPSARTATIVYDDVTFVFAIGATVMTINNTEKTIPAPAVIQNDRTMIPLRTAAEAIGAIVTYDKDTVTFTKADTLTVSNFDQLQQAVVSSASTIMVKDFDATGETTTKLVIQRPLVLDGNGANVDFGFEILSNGVTVKNFNVTISEFDKAVSAMKNGKKVGGDCIAVEIHNDNTGDPVIISGMTIVHDVFQNNNSAIYLADGAYVHILNNNITVENKENNSRERGGIYIGSGTSGKIIGNTIDSARTGFPMSPMGLTANLDALTEEISMPDLEIKDNNVESIYVTKMYTNGALFGDDGGIKEDDSDFGVREALGDFLVALEKNNAFTTKEGYPKEGEDRFVTCRLDLIYAGKPASEWNIFFDVEDGKLVRTISVEAEA